MMLQHNLTLLDNYKTMISNNEINFKIINDTTALIEKYLQGQLISEFTEEEKKRQHFITNNSLTPDSDTTGLTPHEVNMEILVSMQILVFNLHSIINLVIEHLKKLETTTDSSNNATSEYDILYMPESPINNDNPPAFIDPTNDVTPELKAGSLQGSATDDSQSKVTTDSNNNSASTISAESQAKIEIINKYIEFLSTTFFYQDQMEVDKLGEQAKLIVMTYLKPSKAQVFAKHIDERQTYVQNNDIPLILKKELRILSFLKNNELTLKIKNHTEATHADGSHIQQSTLANSNNQGAAINDISQSKIETVNKYIAQMTIISPKKQDQTEIDSLEKQVALIVKDYLGQPKAEKFLQSINERKIYLQGKNSYLQAVAEIGIISFFSGNKLIAKIKENSPLQNSPTNSYTQKTQLNDWGNGKTKRKSENPLGSGENLGNPLASDIDDSNFRKRHKY